MKSKDFLVGEHWKQLETLTPCESRKFISNCLASCTFLSYTIWAHSFTITNKVSCISSTSKNELNRIVVKQIIHNWLSLPCICFCVFICIYVYKCMYVYYMYLWSYLQRLLSTSSKKIKSPISPKRAVKHWP